MFTCGILRHVRNAEQVSHNQNLPLQGSTQIHAKKYDFPLLPSNYSTQGGPPKCTTTPNTLPWGRPKTSGWAVVWRCGVRRSTRNRQGPPKWQWFLFGVPLDTNKQGVPDREKLCWDRHVLGGRVFEMMANSFLTTILWDCCVLGVVYL